MIKVLYLLITYIIITTQLYGELVWEATGEQESRVRIELSDLPVDVDKKVQVRVTLQAPKGYQVDKGKIRNQLLNFIGFGPSPFTLLSEETSIVNEQTTKITYTLDPEIAGNHQLTLGKIVFEPISKDKQKSLEIMTGVFVVPIILKTDMIGYQGLPARLLPLSMKLPVDISPKNYEDFVENDQISANLLEQSRSLLPKRGRIATLAALCLLFGLMVVLQRYWRKAMQPSKEKIREKLAQSAAESAMVHLEELKNQNSLETGGYERYYNSLTAIVRQFIEEAYNIRASRLTTIEFLEYAATHPELEEGSREILAQFLTNADQVKFAQANSTPEKCETALQQAMQIVHTST